MRSGQQLKWLVQAPREFRLKKFSLVVNIEKVASNSSGLLFFFCFCFYYFLHVLHPIEIVLERETD